MWTPLGRGGPFCIPLFEENSASWCFCFLYTRSLDPSFALGFELLFHCKLFNTTPIYLTFRLVHHITASKPLKGTYSLNHSIINIITMRFELASILLTASLAAAQTATSAAAPAASSCEAQNIVVHLARVFGKAGASGQGGGIQHFVELKLQVTAGEEGGHSDSLRVELRPA